VERFEDNGDKKLAYSGQRPEGMQDCNGCQGPRRTVVLQVEIEVKEEEEEENHNIPGLIVFKEKDIEINVMFLEHTVAVTCLY
jgi:hypothetical protein